MSTPHEQYVAQSTVLLPVAADESNTATLPLGQADLSPFMDFLFLLSAAAILSYIFLTICILSAGLTVVLKMTSSTGKEKSGSPAQGKRLNVAPRK
jgi:hypothetical protein